MRAFIAACSCSFVIVAVGCKTSPPEPDSTQAAPSGVAMAATGAGLSSPLSGSGATAGSSSGDPFNGVFTLADATKGIPGTGALIATFDTSNGTLTCKLLDD